MLKPSLSPTNPQLSPGFERARRISRIISILLAIAFWSMLLVLAFLCGVALWPHEAAIGAMSPGVHLGLPFAYFLSIGPVVVALHYGQRVFIHFAHGEVFSTATVAHIRLSALLISRG